MIHSESYDSAHCKLGEGVFAGGYTGKDPISNEKFRRLKKTVILKTIKGFFRGNRFLK